MMLMPMECDAWLKRAFVPAYGDDAHRADEEIEAALREGARAWACIGGQGETLGYVLMGVRDGVGRIHAAASTTQTTDAIEHFLTMIESELIGMGAVILRATTFRRGLIKRLSQAGYEPVGVEMERRA